MQIRDCKEFESQFCPDFPWQRKFFILKALLNKIMRTVVHLNSNFLNVICQTEICTEIRVRSTTQGKNVNFVLKWVHLMTAI